MFFFPKLHALAAAPSLSRKQGQPGNAVAVARRGSWRASLRLGMLPPVVIRTASLVEHGPFFSVLAQLAMPSWNPQMPALCSKQEAKDLMDVSGIWNISSCAYCPHQVSKHVKTKSVKM